MVLTKRSPEQESPQEGQNAEPLGDASPSQEASENTGAASEQKPEESGQQKNRLKELHDDLHSDTAEGDSDELRDEDAALPHERVQNLRSAHGEYVRDFVPHARLQVTREALGGNASYLARVAFAFRRKLGMLPEKQLDQLDNREADLIEQFVAEAGHTFPEETAERAASLEGDERPEASTEPVDARRVASPDIRGVMTRGEHDAEQERHNEQAA